MGKSQPGVADRFFDADGTGTAFYAWKAWPVVRQANPRRQFFDSPRYAGRADTVFLWGFGDRPENESAREVARRDSAQIMFCEDGLLKSADTWANGSAPLRYRRGCSVMFDTRTPYFDATRPSDLEPALNDPALRRRRARLKMRGASSPASWAQSSRNTTTSRWTARILDAADAPRSWSSTSPTATGR